MGRKNNAGFQPLPKMLPYNVPYISNPEDKEVYGNEYHADALMAANPEHIDTFRFSAGVVLKTPTVEDARAGTLPPWKYEAQYE